jgi:nucleoside phosphorylase
VARSSLCKTCRHALHFDDERASDFCERYRKNFGFVNKCCSYKGEQFPVDVAIITATSTETEAVTKHLLREGSKAWSSVPQMAELEWRRAEYTSPSDAENKLRLILAQTRLKGLPAAAVQATRAWHRFQPRYLVMLGITAGREQKTRLGDVVVPDLVFDYGAGKWKGTKFIPEPHQLELDNLFFRACQYLDTQRPELLREIVDEWNGDLPEGTRDLRVRTGHMVSGAAVIDSDEIWTRLLQHDKEVIAIDMEAYSLLLTGR